MTAYAKACKNAIDVQDACNFSGVLLSFARDMEAVRDHMRAEGTYGSEAFATHPVAIAYIDKLSDLQRRPDSMDVSRAFDALDQVDADAQRSQGTPEPPRVS